MSSIILATNNAHKVEEIKHILGDKFDCIYTLADRGIKTDVEETGDTFTENALIKARAICKLSGLPALADDSGLCVDVLGGAPGVYSARYSGGDSDDNNALLLANLAKAREEGNSDRTAHFSCAVALVYPDGREITAEGKTYGYITEEYRGKGGFGYDPLFYSPEIGMTFGEAVESVKNSVSHRGRALAALVEKL